MQFSDWELLGIHWLWWAATGAGMMFVWSLLPMRPPVPGRRHRGGETATLAIHSLLWVYEPSYVAKILLQQSGVRTVELDLGHGVARVVFDPHETSVTRLQNFVENCARHCRAERAGPHSCPTDLNGH